MSITPNNLKYFVAKIDIYKKNIFGVKNHFSIIITPYLRIILINKKSKINIPFKKNDYLDLSSLVSWVIKNNMKINYFTSNPKLKRELYFSLEKPIIDNMVSKKKCINYIKKYN